jgi:general secretion pathway protein G
MLPGSFRRAQAGMTLLELILSCAILVVLASAALPIARYTIWHKKEKMLRYNLQVIRDAIDSYKQVADNQQIKVDPSTQGYPPDLDTLVKGVPLANNGGGGTAVLNGGNSSSTSSSSSSSGTGAGDSSAKVIRFLRKVPIDPITGKADWRLRSVGDDYDSTSWGGKNVFDIYSNSTDTAIDGSRYSDW